MVEFSSSSPAHPSCAPPPDLPRPDATEGSAGLVVWKFGGTSVRDRRRLRAVAERLVAARRDGRRVVAVLSAMGDSTDHLLRLAREYAPRPPARELDSLLSLGECISCSLAAMAVHELGERAVSFTGPQAGVITDDAHGAARLREIRPQRIVEALDEGLIVLVTGFQGVSPRGDVTTLGRGGSDLSAVALAAALGIRRCDIFTDVAGVFTADPRVVPAARRLAALDHEEMLQLAEAGAAVLHPRSVELAQANDVDIHVRSAFSDEAGTWIRKDQPMVQEAKIAGVAHRRHERLYAVRDLSPVTVSSAMARRGAAIGTHVCRGDQLQFTAPGVAAAEVEAALAAVGACATLRDDLGAVSVVGTGIGNRPEIAARALAALEHSGIDAQLVMNAPSRVSCHVFSRVVDQTARALHDAFGLHASLACA